jgi:hypothetical protein
METYLRIWIEVFNAHFFKGQPVIIDELAFEKLRIDTLGTYKVLYNDSKPRARVYLNSAHENLDMSDTLQVLIHQMVHVHETIYINGNKPKYTWYHSKAFRDKMESIGIITDPKGCHLAVRDPFRQLLMQHGITFRHGKEENGMLILHPRPKPRGRSRLRKWSCGCTNVRVGKAEFEATCDICSNKFKLISISE